MFRTDLPRGWLVTTCYAVIHAAAGKLAPSKAPKVLTSTVLSLLWAG